MSCLDELTLLTYADRELDPGEIGGVEHHLGTCAACRALLASLRSEDELLADVLRRPAIDARPTAVPEPREGTVALLLGAAAALAGSAFLSAADAGSPLWLRSLGSRAVVSLAFDGLFALEEGGTIMIVNALGIGLAASVVLLALYLVATRGLRRGRAAPALSLLALAVAVAAGPAQAFEVRRGDSVTVGPEETIDGRAVLSGQYVTLEGKVRGDVAAAGRHVVVRGTVGGDLYVAGEEVEILGVVEGNVHAAAGTLRLESTVGRSAWLAGREVTLTPAAVVTGDLAGGAEQLRIEGKVGRDADVACRELYVAGSTGRNLTAWTEAGQIDRAARIGGDLTARVAREGGLRISEQATIAGRRDVTVHPEMTARHGHDRLGWVLFSGTFGLLATLLFAFLAFRFAPGTIPAAPAGTSQVARWLGLGFVLLVTVPFACFFAGLTVVGIPLALMTFGLYLAACYLAPIAVAIVLGRRLLAPGEALGRFLVATGLGWAILFALGHIPFVGAGVRFLVLLVGLGALFGTLREALRGRARPAPAVDAGAGV